MTNIHLQFSTIASIATAKQTVIDDGENGIRKIPSDADKATAQTALDAVASAFATLNG